jgi:hypothetical protein
MRHTMAVAVDTAAREHVAARAPASTRGSVTM